jgi:hypothetical protein
MTIERLSAILPLKLRGSYHRENLARGRILFTSLLAFAEPDLFQEIHVVTPPGDVEAARGMAADWPSLPLRIVDERDYLPTLRRRWFSNGHHIQQLIKLTAANRLVTPFFLTLDPDVILCKPLRREDLFLGERALLDTYPRRANPDCWNGAARVLGLSADLSADGMMVTPALLSRAVCQELFRRLEQRHGGDWATTLLRLGRWGWTEYALYHLVAESEGMLDQVHAVAGPGAPRRLMCPTAVWAEFQFERWNLPECFDPNTPGFFTLVQSNTRISPERIEARLAPYLAIRAREDGGTATLAGSTVLAGTPRPSAS